MNENKWSAKICAEMRKCNAFVFRIVGQMRQQPGIPDAIVLHKGVVFFIEFKGEKTGIRPIQVQVMKDIEKKRGNVFVVREGVNAIYSPEGTLRSVFQGTGASLLRTLHIIVEQSL